MILIYIIILNWDGKKDTLTCLESLEKLKVTNEELRIVIVDNGSEEKLTVKGQELTVIRNNANLGYAGGNNVGIRYALEHGADYLLILNNDTIVHKDLVVQLLDVAKKDDQVGIVAPKIYFAKGYEFHKDRYKENQLGRVLWYAGGVMDFANVSGHHRGVDEVDRGQYDRQEETDYASGCCMLVKKGIFENVGLFDERYFLYYEDSDFSQRVKRRGFKIVYAPKALLWHKNAGSAGGSGSTLQDYYITRNRLFFGMRYAPLRSKVALLRESVNLLLNGRRWQKQGIADFYLGRFGKGSFQV